MSLEPNAFLRFSRKTFWGIVVGVGAGRRGGGDCRPDGCGGKGFRRERRTAMRLSRFLWRAENERSKEEGLDGRRKSSSSDLVAKADVV
jgi:hypothetical protein